MTQRRGSPSRRSFPAALVALAVASPALCQSVEFNPSVFLNENYNSNVQYLGTTGEGQADWSTTLGVELPVRHDWRTGSVSFSYKPSYTRHANLTALDRDEHFLSLGCTQETSRSTRLDVFAGYQLTQLQTIPDYTAGNPDLFLATRTDRTQLRGGLEFFQQISSKWNWTAATSALRERYDAIQDFQTTAPTAVAEGRDLYTGTLQFDRRITEPTSLRAIYAYERAELEFSGDSDTHLLGLGVVHTSGRTLSMSLDVGGYYRYSQLIGIDGQPLPDDKGGSFRGELTKAFRSADLTARASYLPTGGGALAGVSTTASVALGLTGHDRADRWLWTAFASLNQRDPTDPGVATTYSVAGDFSVEWRPTAPLALRLDGSLSKQNGGDTTLLDGSYTRASLGVVWYPLGPEPRSREVSR